ncbi:MAG: cation diffusion facilitator family transporter, partial [Hoeflea sp.]|nr:cation diffusion facilitator family transporter [Hoeflea sp.]
MAGHHHHHHHVDPDAGDSRVAWAVVVNLGLTVAQIIGGIFSGSLAMIADAIHNLSDALSLIIAFLARKIARRPADGSMTFGYGRAEVVAALINYTTLIVIGLYLVYEAVMRFLTPSGVDGWLVVIIAGVALAVDMVTALLTYRLSKESVNIRAAFLHNVADALGSIAVIFAGTLIILYDWLWIDPAVTLMIAGYILWMSFHEIGGVIRILMLGAPPELSAAKV